MSLWIPLSIPRYLPYGPEKRDSVLPQKLRSETWARERMLVRGAILDVLKGRERRKRSTLFAIESYNAPPIGKRETRTNKAFSTSKLALSKITNRTKVGRLHGGDRHQFTCARQAFA
jgi:hypothetical protein